MGIGVFVIGLSRISSFFSFHIFLNFKLHCNLLVKRNIYITLALRNNTAFVYVIHSQQCRRGYSIATVRVWLAESG